MKAEIDVNQMGFGSIVVDGKDIGKGVTGFTLRAEVGNIPTLALDLAVFSGADIGAEADVVVPAETHDTLVALGWTPPGGA